LGAEKIVAFRKPFTPPSSSTHFVQVRHQHYQGEAHPASRKVSIVVPVSNLRLNPQELHRFKLLAGPRFTPGQGEGEGSFKLSCELYPNDKMNEKWCSDTLDKLLSEAKDSTGKNQFLDQVPLDYRGFNKKEVKSRRSKKTLGLKDFPKEWLRPQVRQRDE